MLKRPRLSQSQHLKSTPCHPDDARSQLPMIQRRIILISSLWCFFLRLLAGPIPLSILSSPSGDWCFGDLEPGAGLVNRVLVGVLHHLLSLPVQWCTLHWGEMLLCSFIPDGDCRTWKSVESRRLGHCVILKKLIYFLVIFDDGELDNLPQDSWWPHQRVLCSI